jgi:hypothetical protein
MMQGCCSYGAHFVDDDDVQSVVQAFVKVEPRHMQFHAEALADGFLEPGDPDDEGKPTTVSRLVDDACIFLNRPGFEGGVGCALHIAALEAGARPLDWKPNVCWQVPIRLEHATDDNGHVTSRLREWKRRDWGSGGDDFHWWCTEAPEAFSGRNPVYRASRDEIVELVGERIYDLMIGQLERPQWTPLPHPTLRQGRPNSTKASKQKTSKKKTSNTKTSKTKTSNTKTSNTKTSNAKTSKTKTSNTKTSNTKTSNATTSKTKTSNTKTPNAKTSKTKTRNAKTSKKKKR